MAFRLFKSQTVNVVVLGLLVATPAGAFIMHVGPSHWPRFLWACITISLFAATFHYWRLLKMQEAPVSTIAAAAQGYVELYGKASTATPLRTPFHGIPCVWYRAWVYANQQSPRGAEYFFDNRLLEYTESQSTLILSDDSGQCEVDLSGAEVIYYEARTWRKNNHRYVEQYLPANQNIYVIGHLDTRHELLHPSALNQAVSARLKDMKSRPQQLLNQYDHNLNGEIDMDEWEKARQDVIHQVKSSHAMQAHTGSFMLSKPADGHMFLISAKSPTQLRLRHQQWLMAYLIIAIALLVFSLMRV
ncbi:MAG: hypothetical protein B7X95_00300 [Methylophilaceae bacterium 17-44-8]|nr:MAG: hypothetical protein B7X95_00300 [Methylophilaceae bacterium 17-44-8]